MEVASPPISRSFSTRKKNPVLAMAVRAACCLFLGFVVHAGGAGNRLRHSLRIRYLSTR